MWRASSRALAIGYGLIIGGAIGNNLIDRVIYGKVADFFHFYGFGYDWYVFNVADWRSLWAPWRSCMMCCSRRSPMGIRAMRFEMRLLATLLSLGLAVAALSGCEDLRRAAGLNKKSPDEFAVTTKAPLVIPPDFNLRPPMPGAPPANTLDPSSNAELALFSNTDPADRGRRHAGNYTPGEKMLLANAKVQQADPGIRARLNADQRAAVQNADRSFTDRC